MASKVRISELPLVSGINNNDVLVINEKNVISSGITLLDFTREFLAQDLQITGDATFHGEVEINNDLEVNGEASFNNIVTFEEPVVFKNAVTIENFSGISLDDLGDVELNTPQHLDLLLYNAPFQRWENDGDTYMRDVVQDNSPQLGGNLDTNNQVIFSDNALNLEFVSSGGNYNLRSDSSQPAVIRICSDISNRFVEITTPTSSLLPVGYTLTLPNSPGSSGQVLATNGSGLLYWTTNNGSGGGGGSGGGIALSDLSVQTVTPNGGGTLNYNPGNGVFYFAPADLASIVGIGYGDLSVTKSPPKDGGDLVYDDAGNFTFTPADTSDFIKDVTGQKIGDLLDVNDTGVNTGQALIYDNLTQTYKPGDVSIGNSVISDLDDVDTTGVSDGDYLVYNAADSEWKASELAIQNALIFKGVCDLTKPISDADNIDVDPTNNVAGHFWINVDTGVGAIDAEWVGLTGNALGLEYVVYTPKDQYYILGTTGTLTGIIQVQPGDGIGVDVTPDATRPTVYLLDSGVTAGDYSIPTLTVNDKGQITDIDEVDVDVLLEDYARLDGADFYGEISVSDKRDADPTNHVENFRVNLDGTIKAGELTFPISDGNANQVLSTDGSGNIIFSDAGSSVHVSEVPPGSPEQGDLWYDSITGGLFIWYTDTDSGQWVSISGGGSGGGGGGSDFQITVGSTPHTTAIIGDLWVTPVYDMFVYDGSWVQINGGSTDAEVDLDSYPSLP